MSKSEQDELLASLVSNNETNETKDTADKDTSNGIKPHIEQNPAEKTDEAENDGIKPQNLLTDEEPDIKAPAKKDQVDEPADPFPKGNQQKTADNSSKTKAAFPLTWSGTIYKVTRDFLNNVDLKRDDLDPQIIAARITAQVTLAISSRNLDNPQDKWKIPHDLLPQQIASCLAKLHHIVLINMTDKAASTDYDTLAIYQDKGPNKGIYLTDQDLFDDLARKYNYSLTTKDLKEVRVALRSMVVHTTRNHNENLIPVNNGIYNYATKTLLPFDPKLVFISKSHVDYVENATNPIIHNDKDGTDWDVVSWMNSLSDDPGIVNLLWQILGAIIRPNVSWDQSAWLYSTKGNNGKGTLCELMRNLCGPGSYAKISLNEFSQDFMLEPLTHATAIITDENDVGTYIDKAANLKSIVTGDVITINRKFKDPVVYQFKGFMVQCLNEYPKIKDKSNSLYRRFIFIPMNKNFQGRERKYIKQKYLQRKDVLEYVLYHLLHDTDYYELSVPKACKNVLEDYKAYNDPIREFLKDIIPECKWDLLPFNFLYALYRAWFRRNMPNGKEVSNRAFTNELKEIFEGSAPFGFTCIGSGQTRTGNRINQPEPLILEYNLRDWMNPNVSGADRDRKAIPVLRPRYYGLVRKEN